MSMDKITEINLESTANYQSLTNLGVQFYQQDLNTAVLKFRITRNNEPLLLSVENIKVIIALESGKSFIASDSLVYEDELGGIVTYTIPNEFLQVATDVLGQVYVGTLDGDEVIVSRQFSFTVSNDLLSSLPTETALRYITMFDDLKVEINNRLLSLEEQFITMEDYVGQVNQATTDGLAALNNLVNAKTAEYNNNHENKLALINTTVDGYVQDFLDQRSYIDTKYSEFQTAVAGADVVTETEATNWQKYKMVKDDGTRTYLTKGSFADVLALEPGYYETVTNDTPTQGFPTDITNAAFVEIDVTKSGSGRKQIKVVQSSNSKTFVKYIHTDGLDNGWKQVAVVDSLASLETTTESQNKANTAENNAKVYADAQIANRTKTLFSGSVNAVGSVIGVSENIYNFSMIVISGKYPGGSFSVVVVPTALDTTTIAIQQTNISNATGSNPYMYEVNLSVNTAGTQMTITGDVSNSISSDTASGADANSFTFYKVIGLR